MSRKWWVAVSSALRTVSVKRTVTCWPPWRVQPAGVPRRPKQACSVVSCTASGGSSYFVKKKTLLNKENQLENNILFITGVYQKIPWSGFWGISGCICCFPIILLKERSGYEQGARLPVFTAGPAALQDSGCSGCSASAAPPAERGWSKDSFCPGVGSGLGVCKRKSLEQYVLYRYLLLRLLNVHFSSFLNVRLVYLFEVFICISFVFWMSSWLYSFIFSSFTHGSYFDKWWCWWSYVNSVPQNRGFCICAVSR